MYRLLRQKVIQFQRGIGSTRCFYSVAGPDAVYEAKPKYPRVIAFLDEIRKGVKLHELQ